MSRRDAEDRNPTPEELLAAYAAGELDGDEAAAVEERLAADPTARAEMESAREAITATRRAQPRPEIEPAWDEMAREIAAECDRAQAERARPGLLETLLDRIRAPRYAAAAVCVATAALLVVLALRDREAATPHPDRAPVDVAKKTPTTDQRPLPDLRASEIEELDESELEALLADLTGQAVEEIEPAERLLPAELVAEWAGVAADDPDQGELGYATGFGLDVFAEPNYETWLEDLAEAEIDALAEYLDEVQAG